MIVLLPFDTHVIVTKLCRQYKESFRMQIILKIKRLQILFLGLIFITACQTQVSENKNFDLDNLFQQYKADMDLTSEYSLLKLEKLEYKAFSKENIVENIRNAVSNDPKVQGYISRIEARLQEVEVIKAKKALQASGTLSGGANREDNDSEVALVGQISAQKLMFDFGANDASEAASLEMVEIGKLDALIEAERTALSLYEALIDYKKTHQINKIYEEGMILAEPLLGQIKNISLSGIADKSSLLEAQEKYTRLEIGLEKSRAAAEISKDKVLKLFQIETIGLVDKIDPLPVNFQGDNIEDQIENNYQLRAQVHYERSMLLQKKSLEVGDSPSISFSSSLVAPAKDFSQDSIANAGFLVNYIFNDGGARKAQISALKADIDYINSDQSELVAELTTNLVSLNRQYLIAKKTQFALDDLLDLSKELRDTTKAQLISGRSSVQDILSAEVKLAEIKIERIVAESEANLASYKFNTIDGQLLTYINWDLPQK
jgi:outer membrane protein TolC